MEKEGIIEKVVYGGKSLLREDSKIVFLNSGYPGEKVKYEIIKNKKDIDFGITKDILTPIKERVRPTCKYFYECGGCRFMDAKYSFQLKLKRDMILDQLSRMTKIDLLEIDNKVKKFIPMNDPYYYRNKIELSVKNGRAGYLSMDRNLTEIDECKIASKKINKIIRIIKNKLNETPLKSLNHIIIKSTSLGESMVNLVMNSPLRSKSLIQALKKSVDSIFITSKNGWSKLVYGQGVIHEKIDDVEFLIKPKSFFQTNFYQTKRLTDTIKDIIIENEMSKIIDAYGGMGLFSLLLSKHIERSIVVDLSKDSISAGIHSAKMNRIKNVEYVNLPFENFEYPEGFDLVLDPPREGLSKEVVNKIQKVGPSKILYISCNLATFSRDLAKLSSFGYNMQYVIPFDMFPHTYHMETLTLLTKQEVIK